VVTMGLWIESWISVCWDTLSFPFRQLLDFWCLPIALVPWDLWCGWSNKVKQDRHITLGRPVCMSATWSKWFHTSAERVSIDHLILDLPFPFNCLPYSVCSHHNKKTFLYSASYKIHFFLRSGPTRLRIVGGSPKAKKESGLGLARGFDIS
jgi:hypothetical protein